MKLSQPPKFFAGVRTGALLGPTLDQSEVDGCNAILAACGAAGWPLADTAYALATAYHETAGTMQPIRERGGAAYFTRRYDITGEKPALAKQLGNTQPGDGARYPGRGYVQLTGRANYAKAGTALRCDLLGQPDRALEPAIAAAVVVRGMSEGWFTGRTLARCLPRTGPATAVQFSVARTIINGRDRAEQIAAEALLFQAALIAGGWA